MEKIINTSYVSLNTHSSWSLGLGLSTPKQLFEKAKEMGSRAVCVTDYDSMAGMWDCLKLSRETGIKFIAGCEFNFVDDLDNKDDTRLTKIVLIAKNSIGYKNMLALRKHGFDLAYTTKSKSYSRISWDLLKKHSQGLICLSGDGNGYISQIIMNDGLVKEAVLKFYNIFKEDFALQLMPNNLQIKANPASGPVDQRKINIGLKKIHEEFPHIKCIVATGSYYTEKEHHESHDVLLAISSGQPVYSGQRLKFDKKDFYIKTEEEVRSYFSRHTNLWSKEFVDSMFKNIDDFVDSCEESEWIDPKFSNASGKELPEFPVADQDDYNEFLEWKSKASSIFFDSSLDDASLYYRFSSENGLRKKIEQGNIPVEDINYCHEQMKEEFDVFECRGFSSYMSMVAAFIKWCKINDIPVGPGRGCTTNNTNILTPHGYKKISEISGGDEVITHTGFAKKVVCKFNNGVSNNIISIKTDRSFRELKFTNNHKVLATKDYSKTPKWVKVSALTNEWYLYSPWPNRSIIEQKPIDFYEFCANSNGSRKYSVDNDFISIHDTGVISKFSMRHISRELNIAYGHIYNFKRGNNTKFKKEILEYFEKNKIDISSWRYSKNTYVIPRHINIDNDFCYLLGRWVGDGSYHGKNKGITISFNSKDLEGISKVKSILIKLFGKVYENKKHGAVNGKSNCVSLTCCSNAVFLLFKSIFPEYKNSSSKYFPDFFRSLNQDCLNNLILGYFEADGSIQQNYSFKFKSISLKLTNQLREALLFSKIYSAVYVEKSPKRNGAINKTSYSTLGPLLMFKERILNSVPYKARRVIENGYFCKIKSIRKVGKEETFDIKVKDNSSYYTDNYAVHNSVGGSLTAYLNEIHEAYPKKYDLIFARFLNKFKDAYPDCDIDFSPTGRSFLHDHLRDKYGKEYVAHVSNINTITPKVYARDIARVFEFGDDGRTAAAAIGDDIADSISSEYSRVTTALAQAPLFQEYAKQYPELEKHAILGGKNRAWSTHAAGVIISKRPLHTIVPVRRDSHGAYCLEYEKNRAEENGLVKMDTLGLETLDIIKKTYAIIKEVGKTPPADPFNYDAYDEKTYELLSKGDTFCIFQLTGVAAPVCKMLQPKSIEDIAIITALIRPAAKDIIPEFMKVRSGEKEMHLLHPSLKRAFEKTYGFGLFEESLLYIANDVANWDLHSADRLRKLTKEKGKNPEKVQKWKEEFISDSMKNGIDKDITIKIWEIIEKFQGYGFNKSHAILYSFITYKTAYLKAHFPLEFLVANLMSKVSSNNPKSKDEVIRIKREIRALGVNIVPPDINTSDITYKIINDNTLMTGLDGLRNVKEASIEELKEKRPFNNFKDLIERTDTSKCKSPVIQSLAAAGALDSFGLKREQMFFYCSDYRKKLGALKTSLYKKVDKGKLTKEAADLELSEFVYPFPENEKLWMPHEIFAIEEHFLGEGITGSLKDRFPKFFDDKVIDFSSLPKIIDYIEYSDDERENRRANTHNIDNHGIFGLKGIITNLFEFKVKKEDSKIFGQVMARLTVEDLFGNPLDIIAFPSTWETAKGRVEKELSGGKAELKEGMAIYFNGAFQWENEHTYSFILGDILSYKDSPKIPKSLKSKAVKIPRKKNLKKSDIMELSKEDLADELEDEMLFDGSSTIKDDEYDFR